jgi:hypothetical protein
LQQSQQSQQSQQTQQSQQLQQLEQLQQPKIQKRQFPISPSPQDICKKHGWKPVCGEDRETYFNQCDADHAKVEVLCSGECPCKDCPCTDNWDPVCGDDGNTHTNDCHAGCAGTGFYCRFECPCPVSTAALHTAVGDKVQQHHAAAVTTI